MLFLLKFHEIRQHYLAVVETLCNNKTLAKKLQRNSLTTKLAENAVENIILKS